MPTVTLKTSWKIHDNWTELLDGTYYLLTSVINEHNSKVPKNIIARSILTNSHQLVEVMFFNVVNKYLDENECKLGPAIVKEVSSGLNDNIGIKKAMSEWPELLTGKKFDRSCEPFSSQEKLRTLRNQIIHWPSVVSVSALAESAFYTAVRASESIYSHFFVWPESEYSKFVQSVSLSSGNIYLVKRIQEGRY